MKEQTYKVMLYVHKDGVDGEIYSQEIDLPLTEEDILFFAAKMNELNDGRPFAVEYDSCHALMDDIEDELLEQYNAQVHDEWEEMLDDKEKSTEECNDFLNNNLGDMAIVWDFEDKLWRDASKYMEPISVFVLAEDNSCADKVLGVDVEISATLYYDLMNAAFDYAEERDADTPLLAYIKLHNYELYEQWMTLLTQAYEQAGIEGSLTLPSEIIDLSQVEPDWLDE